MKPPLASTGLIFLDMCHTPVFYLVLAREQINRNGEGSGRSRER